MYINVSLRIKQVFKHFFDFLFVLKINRAQLKSYYLR